MATDIGWTALQWPGIEHVVVSGDEGGYRAEGQLIMAEDGLITVRYSLTCGPGWRFRAVTVSVISAAGQRTLTLARDAAGGWLADGQPRPDLGPCDDIDINCTPLTNTLPIRRLDWSAGQAYDLDVAYVSVPELDVRKDGQRYTELGGGTTAFRYESGSFLADLAVDADGFVLDYPGIWRRLGPAACGT
jgi:uncharacterized protein